MHAFILVVFAVIDIAKLAVVKTECMQLSRVCLFISLPCTIQYVLDQSMYSCMRIALMYCLLSSFSWPSPLVQFWLNTF